LSAAESYQYQICLFIQMQLCTPVTLADWIRMRNTDPGFRTLQSRLDMASQIFQQLARGLAHVHHKGIIHRYWFTYGSSFCFIVMSFRPLSDMGVL
jgi:serine/threonine protein kinase